ncbi:hypothetical protein HPB50_014147 [Hyalomma asiaticum]|uniref:Uncharacterized protein n=1 Tax=Hyalomma asiaticum TaxID=266040 RepID=A0ACB7THE6_HYAAI|nr:hypothetical protein HPB50_014147 [Hyalomma asiaticum]
MSAEQGMLAATEEPLPLLPMDIEPEADVPSASSNHSEDAAEILRRIQEVQWRHHSVAANNPSYLTALQQVLQELEMVSKEPQIIATYFTMKAACKSARRRGRAIKVQPTSIARRRTGVTRGSGRVPAGRPSKRLAIKKTKRAHALHLSVKDGVPHAKSHGAGH